MRCLPLFAACATLLWAALEPRPREVRRVWTVEHGLPSNNVLSLNRQGHGPLWVGTDAGLARFNGVTFKTYGSAIVTALTQSPQGTLWVGTRGQGVYWMAGGALQRVPGLEPTSEVSVTALAAVHDGSVWIASDNGLTRWHASGVRQFRVRDGLPRKLVLSVRPASRETVVAVTDLGAVEMGPKGLIRSVAAGSVQAPAVSVVDSEGSTWTGSSAGLHRLGQSRVEVLGVPEGLLSDDVRTITRAGSGEFWIATDKGIVSTASGRLPPLPRDAVVNTFLEVDRGHLLAGTHGQGLWRRRGGSWELVSLPDEGRGGRYVLCLRKLRNGEVWAGTSGGILRILGDSNVVQYGRFQGLASNGVHDIYEDEAGIVWAATDAGLSRWNGNVWTTIAAVGRRAIIALQPDGSGGFWLGCRDGIHHWNPATELRSFLVEEAACQGRILGLAKNESDLWWLSDRGVCRGTLAGGKVAARMLAHASGTRYESGWQSAIASDEDSLWFATPQGVLRFKKKRPSPFVHAVIDDVKVEGGNVQPDRPIRLKPTEDRIDIGFASLSLAEPELIRYRYRLVGLTTEWTDAGQRHSASYAHLPRRELRFEVSARHAEGDWGPPAQIAFALEPHFYQTTWFGALVLLAGSAAVYALHRRRIRLAEHRWQALADERTRIARELHDSLAQGIGGISMQLEAARMVGSSAPEKAEAHLNRARNLARASLDDVRAFVRDLRSGVIARGRVEDEIRRFAAEMDSVDVHVDVTGKARPLDDLSYTCVYRVAQEALRNAARHGAATTVNVRITYSDNTVLLTVEDDGRGFDARGSFVESGHFGLVGMQERAASTGAALRVRSAPGSGTTVELEAPYERNSRAGAR